MLPSSTLSKRHWILLYVGVGLLSLAALFLWLEHLTHVAFMAHLAAIPIEILGGAVVVERWLASNEKAARRRQFMYFKSYIFRSAMRDIFISNFAGLVEPRITLEWIKTANASELRAVRDGLRAPRYASPAVVDGILDAYVRSRQAFVTFMEWAASNDFESIFHDMLYILHFIEDVESFRRQNPGALFAEEAARSPKRQAKVDKVLRDGVVKFLDYVIELRDQEPFVLEELLDDYVRAAQFRG